MEVQPSSLAARRRRSPPTIWKRSAIGRTRMGTQSPACFIEPASSRKLLSSKTSRIWYGEGSMRSIGRVRNWRPAPDSEDGWLSFVDGSSEVLLEDGFESIVASSDMFCAPE